MKDNIGVQLSQLLRDFGYCRQPTGIKGQICPNINVYNNCGESFRFENSFWNNDNALTLEGLHYICGIGNDDVKCYLKGLRDCPNSHLQFRYELFDYYKWNVSPIEQLLASGCHTPESEAFMSSYGCFRRNILKSSYKTCISQAYDANRHMVHNNIIPCGLLKQIKNCITTYVGTDCNNQRALDFFLKWYYINGKFASGCSAGNGLESFKMAGTFSLVGTIYIVLIRLM